MATIHDTTMSPSKLELLTTWLPRQPWYAGPPAPTLAKAGGFRLDDPAGEVGIEFMFVTATGDGAAITYHLPMTYRGDPLPGAKSALIGTATHGVLGPRWIYDGVADPVLVEQLAQLLHGRVRVQHQNRSNEVDDTVTVRPADDPTAVRSSGSVAHIVRILAAGGGGVPPYVTATWTMPTGERATGVVIAPPA